MGLGLSGIVSSVPIIIIIMIVALPVAFIAMNPMGFLDIMVATGQFIVTTIIDIIKGGFAVLWWVIQAIGVTIGNSAIWTCNLLISVLNTLPNALNNMLPDWAKNAFQFKTIPAINYLSMPKIDPTISNIVNEIMDGYTTLRLKVSDYWATVNANAPMSYVAGGVAGAGSAGATYLLLAQETSKKAIGSVSSKPRSEKIDITGSMKKLRYYSKKGYKIVVDGKTGRTYAIKPKKAKTVSL